MPCAHAGEYTHELVFALPGMSPGPAFRLVQAHDSVTLLPAEATWEPKHLHTPPRNLTRPYVPRHPPSSQQRVLARQEQNRTKPPFRLRTSASAVAETHSRDLT